MQEQTTNLNGDDFCALRYFDGNKAISHVTRDDQETLKCCAVGISVSFLREKVERNQTQRAAGYDEYLITGILQ